MDDWLSWARALQSAAQNGLTFSKDQFDRERYESIRSLAVDLVARVTDFPREKVNEVFLAEAGYATPKIDVRGAVFREGKILLVRERSDGGWTLPGGWADVGESAAEAVVREVREESGYDTRATKLLAVLDRNKHSHPRQWTHIYKFFFLCEMKGGEPTVNNEIDEIDFFSPDAIPALSSPRVTTEQIARLFDHSAHPDWPTDFD